jgi:antitoxin component YwqK of YwqJK toxin-antitoxin module
MEPERTYYDDGSIQDERWIVNNELHRLDGPAYIWYNEDGSIYREQWFVNGELHRVDGPAYIWYYKNGSIGSEHWYINGIYINDNIIPWLEENNIIAPFSEEDLVAIKLRWG